MSTIIFHGISILAQITQRTKWSKLEGTYISETT